MPDSPILGGRLRFCFHSALTLADMLFIGRRQMDLDFYEISLSSTGG